MNELQKNNETEIYKKIIYSKLILDFIKYYKQTYEYDDIKKDEEKLKKIEEENNRIIEENKNFCEKMGFDQKMISKKNIEEIYIEIIINFIKSNKFENYQEVDNILNELDFKNIFITNKMFKKLSTILSNEDYIKCYIINDPKDLYNDKIINFYYILLNYIFKNSIYINNIPLLLKLKGKILKFIKNESIYNDGLKEYINENKNGKLSEFLKAITDSEYYLNKIINKINKNEANKSTEEKDSKDDNNDSENSSNKNDKNSINGDYIFNNSSLIKKRAHQNEISYQQNSFNISECMNFSFKDFKYDIKNFFNSEFTFNSEKEQKLENIKNEVEKIEKEKDLNKEDNFIYESFMKLVEYIDKIKSENIGNIKLIFKENEESDENFDGKYKNINCEIIIVGSDLEKKKISELKDILNKEYNMEIFQKSTNFSSLSSIQKQTITSGSTSTNETNKLLHDIKSSIKKIGNHNNKANYVKILNSKIIISGGDEDIFFYNDSYSKITEKTIKNDNIFKIEGVKKNNNIELIVCSDKVKEIMLLTIPNIINNSNDIRTRVLRKMKTRVCFQFNKDFILCNEKGLVQINDLTSNIAKSDESIIPNINTSYWTGIKINKEIIALTSNKNLTKGEDKIIFYNYYGKKTVKTVENYSFSISQNNLALMPIEIKGIIRTTEINDDTNKILLCACKKYKDDQKNGILLLKLDLKNNLKVLSQNFYETENFEVYCFCPIFIFNDINILNKENNKIFETEYFLVGGFNSYKNQGLIKLYKVNYNKDNFEKTEIEYIKNIEEDFISGFKGYVTCIIQSIYDGKFFITCSDGSVYIVNDVNF